MREDVSTSEMWHLKHVWNFKNVWLKLEMSGTMMRYILYMMS